MRRVTKEWDRGIGIRGICAQQRRNGIGAQAMPDPAPAGPWAQSGVRGTGPSQRCGAPRGPHSLSMDLIRYLSVDCFSFKPINFSFSLSYFLFLFFSFPNFLLFLVILECIFQVRGPPRRGGLSPGLMGPDLMGPGLMGPGLMGPGLIGLYVDPAQRIGSKGICADRPYMLEAPFHYSSQKSTVQNDSLISHPYLL